MENLQTLSRDSLVVSKNNSREKLATINEEVFWDKSKIITSKTDARGIIEYANEVFIEISGYQEHELMGKPHSIIRHPDMPKVIFKILWKSLKQGKNFHAVIKNRAKSGRYYWVITDFEIAKNEQGKITNYFARRRAVSDEVVKKHIVPLYKKLLLIEKESGMDVSEKYLKGLFEDKNLSYELFIEKVIEKSLKEDRVMNEFEKEMEEVLKKENQKGKNFFKRFFRI